MTATPTRRGVLLAVLAATTGTALAACSSDPAAKTPGSSASLPTAPTSTASTTPSAVSSAPAGHAVNVGTPTRLSIPSINLDEPVTAGGLAKDGTLDPKPGTVQWYNATPTPGQAGYSVIVGHVTYNGPDVFANLTKVHTGDRVSVAGANGSRQAWTVTKTESVNKEALQNRQDVWGTSPTPVLVLVTCDPQSGWANAHHHKDNFVVWAKPA